MKTKPVLVAVSLAANVALALVYFRPAPAAHQTATTTRPSNTPLDTAAAWTELRAATANDDTALVARLRAEGFPPAVIRAIVTAQVSERFTTRRRELESVSGEYAYWKSWSSVQTSNPEARAALRKLQREQSDLLRQLLGEDATPSYARARNEIRYGNLSKDKVEQLELINRDYQELTQQVQSETRGVMLPEDREKLAYIEKERQTDLAALLTPEELSTFELRSSRTAQQLKNRLGLFDATEQEYLALYKLQKVYDDRFSTKTNASFSPSIISSAESKERSEAQKQLTKDIETALGAERYADYKITTDYEYRQVSQLAERLNLPATTAKSVVGLKLDVAERVKAIQSNRTLDEQQRTAQLAAIAEEATTKLSQQLGAEAYAAYRDSSGYWLKNLIRSTTKTR